MLEYNGHDESRTIPVNAVVCSLIVNYSLVQLILMRRILRFSSINLSRKMGLNENSLSKYVKSNNYRESLVT